MEHAMDRFEITDRSSKVVGDQPSAEPDRKLAVMPVSKERKILETHPNTARLQISSMLQPGEYLK